MPSDEPQALTLHFSNHVRIPGEPLYGTVEMDFPRAQADKLEQVRVKLRGVLKTEIIHSTGQGAVVYQKKIPLVREDVVLWTPGSAYPEPEKHTLTFPFTFVLPPDLPPSFHATNGATTATISYSVEAVGDRSGLFHFNRRAGSIFPVVPRASPTQVEARAALLAGWRGGWRSVAAEDKVRPRPWGDYAHIEADLSLPDLPTYPIGTPIPFRLRVMTRTKPMRADEHPPPHPGDKKPLFPAPPASPAEIELELQRTLAVRAQGVSDKFKRKVQDNIGGLGTPEDSATCRAVRVGVQEPVWIPEDPDRKSDGKGAWERTIIYESSFTISCPPSLEDKHITYYYKLHFKVPFSGMFNSLKCDFPMVLDSGLDLPPPIERDTHAPHAPDSSLLMDLPPAYWAGENYDWDFDDKK